MADESWGSALSVPVGRNRMAFRAVGTGPVVVLVHGLGASSRYWSANVPGLAAAGFRVLAPDLPGFGASSRAVPAVTPRDQAGALSGWADAAGVASAVWIGHSLACQSLIELAAARPEIVRALVLAAPTGAGGALRGTRQIIRLARDAPREPRALRRSLMGSYREAGFLTVARAWRAGARHRAAGRARAVEAPALIVSGTCDPVVEPAFLRALAADLPCGAISWIEGATHGLHRSETAAFDAVVVRFLGSLEPPAA
jgi:2-hydroxy-6-oxonona-2,4-dienedioate hydrolase